jgi:hypothetical protein
MEKQTSDENKERRLHINDAAEFPTFTMIKIAP